ncbi:glutathione peroxidase [Raineyella antarctica]|uniref:Glutathione peroxidase n=1 Tax=Raineyella antarctica TaxID=1577474 RepID=A0A1G6GGD7_9ACTN|nr:glutathione peroxidase [Raineyella antarctica]SDB80805.1 glutathione peroxidase [Raineyella antarctica]
MSTTVTLDPATPITTMAGEQVTPAHFAGNVLLVVNVASQCGLTPQYAQLEALQRTYGERGLQVLGFPCNQFKGQEPGTDEEIAAFCSATYGVTFPVFSKIEVNGPGRHPLYQQLTRVPAEPGRREFPGASEREPEDIRWNFEKFLVDREGTVAARFAPDVTPEDPAVVEAIERLL